MEEIFKIHQFDMTWYNKMSNGSNETTKWKNILVYHISDQIWASLQTLFIRVRVISWLLMFKMSKYYFKKTEQHCVD